MGEIIDISVRLCPEIPIWPDSIGFRSVRTMSLENGDPANVTRIDCDVHAGTHIDAPRHFVLDGRTVDEIPLDLLIGPATVVDYPGTGVIPASFLSDIAIPGETRRLLIRTPNSRLWGEGSFNPGYAALSPDAAQWIVNRGVGLVGIDYLSIEPFGGGSEVHRILLDAGVVIIEGLDLSRVDAGGYELICLPLLIAGTEGAPARVVLRKSLMPLNRGGKA
jgi:arylformamidase